MAAAPYGQYGSPARARATPVRAIVRALRRPAGGAAAGVHALPGARLPPRQRPGPPGPAGARPLCAQRGRAGHLGHVRLRPDSREPSRRPCSTSRSRAVQLPAGGPAAGGMVDHRAEGNEGPVKDQGAVGACTAMSLSSAMDSAVQPHGPEQDVGVRGFLHVWSRYGVSNPARERRETATSAKSVALEQTWAYDPVQGLQAPRSRPSDACSVACRVSSAARGVRRGAQGRARGRRRRRPLPALPRSKQAPRQAGQPRGARRGTLGAGDERVDLVLRQRPSLDRARALQSSGHRYRERSTTPGTQVVARQLHRTLPQQDQSSSLVPQQLESVRWGDNGYGWISEAMVTRSPAAAPPTGFTSPMGAGARRPRRACRPCPACRGHRCLGRGKRPAAEAGAPRARCRSPSSAAAFPGGLPGLPGRGQGRRCGNRRLRGHPQGRAPDVMSGQCTPTCAGGAPAVGGMCLPFPGR